MVTLVVRSSLAAETWQREVYKRVNQKMKLQNEEFEEEMHCLRCVVDELRSFRKHVLMERHD